MSQLSRSWDHPRRESRITISREARADRVPRREAHDPGDGRTGGRSDTQGLDLAREPRTRRDLPEFESERCGCGARYLQDPHHQRSRWTSGHLSADLRLSILNVRLSHRQRVARQFPAPVLEMASRLDDAAAECRVHRPRARRLGQDSAGRLTCKPSAEAGRCHCLSPLIVRPDVRRPAGSRQWGQTLICRNEARADIAALYSKPLALLAGPIAQ
jgi:hypothetical protein